jgi:hypothetical protein
MKLLKVKIKRIEESHVTNLEYPKPFWDSTRVVFGPFYEPVNRGEGRTWAWVVLGVRDKDAPLFLRGHLRISGEHTFEVLEISEDEAISFADHWNPKQEVITDERSVLMALTRRSAGRETEEDTEVLDPTIDKPGVNYTKTFSERLIEAKEKF